MRITVGMGASACLALALAGCANKYGVERIDYPVGQPIAVLPAATQPTTARAIPTTACPIVAIMPFVGIDDDPACGYLIADAMADELLTCPDCQILAPDAVTASSGVKDGEDWDPVETGRRVGAPYILTGRVTDYIVTDDDADPIVGVAVRLIETKTGNVVWTGNGAKTAVALPEGGIAVLTSEVCADLAQDIHSKLDKEATAPAPITTVAKVDAPAALTASAKPVEPVEPITIEDDVEPDPVPVARTPKPSVGEGTADWAIPLEDMDKYLEESERNVGRPISMDKESIPPAATVIETVSSVFGNEEEADMAPGAVLVPGAVTITFANDDIRPDEFGIETAAVAAIDTPVAETIETASFLEGPELTSAVTPQEAGRTLDLIEAASFDVVEPETSVLTIGIDIAPATPGSDVSDASPAALTLESVYAEDSEELDGRSPQGFSTQFMVDYSLDLEGETLEPEQFNTPVDDAELDFFGKLSDTLFEELGEG